MSEGMKDEYLFEEFVHNVLIRTTLVDSQRIYKAWFANTAWTHNDSCFPF